MDESVEITSHSLIKVSLNALDSIDKNETQASGADN